MFLISSSEVAAREAVEEAADDEDDEASVLLPEPEDAVPAEESAAELPQAVIRTMLKTRTAERIFLFIIFPFLKVTVIRNQIHFNSGTLKSP